MKVVHIRLPEYIINQLDAYVGKIAATRTGVIWTLLEHGLNYEWKKAIRKAKEEKKQQPEKSENPVTVDQEDNNRKIQQTLALAQKPVKEYFDDEKEYQRKYEEWLRKFEDYL